VIPERAANDGSERAIGATKTSLAEEDRQPSNGLIARYFQFRVDQYVMSEWSVVSVRGYLRQVISHWLARFVCN